MRGFLPQTHPFLQKHAGKIRGVLSCFDRVIFRGYLPISYPQGVGGWMRERGVNYRDFKKFAPQIAERLLQHAKDMAKQAGRLYQHHVKREAKEELAREIARREGIDDGLVCVFSCLETCRTFRLVYSPGRPLLKPDLRRCTVLYYFFMDRECGLIHVKLHTWLPLTCQVYVNGHSWLERQLGKRGLDYQMADNAFTHVGDYEAGQRLADRFVKVNWRRRLDAWAGMVNPLLGEELQSAKGTFDYWWVVDQAEYATDIVFGSREELAELQRDLVAHATLCFSSEDVLRFFGRKPNQTLKAPVQTERKPFVQDEETGQRCVNGRRADGRRVDGVRVRHHLGHNKLKMYDKQGHVLRIETVINDPSQFRVRRRLGKAGRPDESGGRPDKHGKGPLVWLPLRKSVVWLWKYAEVSLAANRRYLEAVAVVNDASRARALLDGATQPQAFNNKRKRALQPLSPQDQALFLAVLRGEHHVLGLRNRDLARELYKTPPVDADERRRRGARVTRLIQLLRAHGLLAKIPRARRYRITERGMHLMCAAVYVRHKYLPHMIMRTAA